MDLALEMGPPRPGVLVSPSLLKYVRGLGLSPLSPRHWGLICLSQAPPDKPLSFWGEGICCSGASWGMSPTLTAWRLTAIS